MAMSDSEQSEENFIPADIRTIVTWNPFKLLWAIEHDLFVAFHNSFYSSALRYQSDDVAFNTLLQQVYQTRQAIQDGIMAEFPGRFRALNISELFHNPDKQAPEAIREVTKIIQLLETILQPHLPIALEKGEQLCSMVSTSSDQELKTLVEAGYHSSRTLARILEWIEIWLEGNRL
jgi:hypothetical protein